MPDNPGEPTPGEGLLPCPFCGAEAYISDGRRTVGCHDCGAEMHNGSDGEGDCVSEWNTRTPPDEVTQKLIEDWRIADRIANISGMQQLREAGRRLVGALATQADEIGRSREWGQRESEAANKLLSESLALLDRATKAERDLAEAFERAASLVSAAPRTGIPSIDAHLDAAFEDASAAIRQLAEEAKG